MPHHLRFLIIAAVLAGLAGCNLGEDTATLNITGVDYAGQGIGAFAVVDPDDPDNRGGGMSITPYSAGGVQCCYELPEEWHEGMTVNVVVRYPLEGGTGDEISASYAKRKAEGTLKHNIQITVPEYNTPARGTLWVQFLPEKKANVVVSDLDPSHPDFPGEVKGWPEPSKEYRRKLIEAKLDDEMNTLAWAQDNLLLAEESNPEIFESYWETFSEVSPERLSPFSGPKDPEFHDYLAEYLEDFVNRTQARIKELKEIKP